MVKLGNYQFDIGGYSNFAELWLGEAAKYLALLLFAVLAIRLWRRLPRLPSAARPGGLWLAGAATVIACAVGYFSLCHSLGRLYSYYGMKALHSGRVLPALALLQVSEGYWKNADTLGEQGVCLLFLDKPAEGIQLLDQAKAMRSGRTTSFEQFFQGLYYLVHGQTGAAVPLLEQASSDSTYRWSVIKLFAVVQLDQNQPGEAAKLMEPFQQVQVTESDHAYIVAALDLAQGKTAEARALVAKYDSDSLPLFWKSRFDKLRAKLQNSQP